MRKWLRLAGLVAVVLILVLVGAVFALKKMFPPERVKRIVLEKVPQFLHREARLGNVEVGIFSGIELSDFALSESPDFARGTFLQSEKFVLKFELLPLLRRQVKVDRLELRSPKIQIVRNADGKTFNFSDLLRHSTAPAPAAAAREAEPEGPPLSFTVSKVALSDGSVEFTDRSPSQVRVALRPIQLTVTGTEVNKPLSIDLAVGLRGTFQSKPLQGDLKLKAVLDLFGQRAQVETLSWKMPELAFQARGKVTGFLKPDLDVSGSISEISLEKLSAWVPLPPELKISGSPKLTFEAKGKLSGLSATAGLDLAQTEVAYANVFRKGSGTNASVHLDASVVDNNEVSLRRLNLALGPLALDVKGNVKSLQSGNPIVKLDVAAAPFPLKEIAALSPLAAPYALGGEVGIGLAVSGPLKLLAFRGHLDLSQVQAKYEKYSLGGVTGRVQFDENSLTVPQLSGLLGPAGKPGSDFQIEASLKNFKAPEIVLDGRLSSLDLALFIPEKKKGEPKPAGKPPTEKKETPPYKGPEMKAQGKIQIGKVLYTKFEGQSAQAAWKLTGITPVLDRLNGTAEFSMSNGKINSIPLLQALAPLLKIDPSGLVYSKMGGHLAFQQGTARTEDFAVLSPSADLLARGSVHLPTNKPDLILTAKLPKGSLGGTLGEFTSDEEGRPTLTFRLRGDWKPSLDTGAIQKKAVEKASEEIKKKASEVIQNEGKKLLDGLFKR